MGAPVYALHARSVRFGAKASDDFRSNTIVAGVNVGDGDACTLDCSMTTPWLLARLGSGAWNKRSSHQLYVASQSKRRLVVASGRIALRVFNEAENGPRCARCKTCSSVSLCTHARFKKGRTQRNLLLGFPSHLPSWFVEPAFKVTHPICCSTR